MTLRRRRLLAGAVAAAAAGPAVGQGRRVFDSHCHIIDPRFPLVANEGYTPPPFPLAEYHAAVRPLGVVGGAVVAGSFQGTNQSWIEGILPQLGPGWVAVAQIAPDCPDEEIARLAALGVRALRFNLYRGRIDSIDEVVALASRAHAIAGWHAEIYADAATLAPHVGRLGRLPGLAIDHLGMTEAGLPVVLDLVAAGAHVKATGFGRVRLDVPRALAAIAAKNPAALVFGTDLPSTRAPRPFDPADLALLETVLGPDLAGRATWTNPISLYRIAAG